jgi:hypothetical protein
VKRFTSVLTLYSKAYFDIGTKRLAAVLLVRVAHRIGPLSSDRRQCLNGLLAQTKDAALSSCLALIVWRCCAMSTSGNCHAFATTMGMSVIETLTFKGADVTQSFNTVNTVKP